ncbi:hypothetical protein EVAR_29741_1 [Eumeta japonica]|uniref:Uncharacterized protein n=1 Tax=Eumeta variegata TaxID=151549 RepID=A0A4C1VZT2_EUMVA|nr:hypothetical protein EVAR_29741_1 [Eumeta japonica]
MSSHLNARTHDTLITRQYQPITQIRSVNLDEINRRRSTAKRRQVARLNRRRRLTTRAIAKTAEVRVSGGIENAHTAFVFLLHSTAAVMVIGGKTPSPAYGRCELLSIIVYSLRMNGIEMPICDSKIMSIF